MIKSIKVAFEGGLGNQLFQLAYGLHLQSKLRCKVFYDVSKYKVERGEYRQFELENIGIPTDWRRCDISKHSGVLGRIERFGLRYLPYIILTFIFLRTSKATNDCTKKKKISDWYSKAINLIGMHRVHSKFYKDPGTSLFSKMIIYGQWFWTEKVVEQREQIRKILDLSFDKGNCNCALSERIIKSESVGVHIRRGDYVGLGKVVCSPDYYNNAIDYINSKIPDAVFYIFSDDVNWAKENIRNDKSITFVDNGNPTIDDFKLLSSCKHFVLSNSTFSWWGAFLGSDENSCVIAPLYWSLDEPKKKSRMLLPEWTAVDNSTI